MVLSTRERLRLTLGDTQEKGSTLAPPPALQGCFSGPKRVTDLPKRVTNGSQAEPGQAETLHAFSVLEMYPLLTVPTVGAVSRTQT